MHALRSRREVVVGSLVLALLAAACGKNASANAGGGTTPAASPSSSPTPSASPSSSPSSGYTSTVDEGPNDSFRFAPSSVTVEGGQTLTLNNVSSTPHTFTVAGKHIDVETMPGSSDRVTIHLPPGRYAFFCRFHQSLGMKGVLVVG
jgi:plastocyanin